MSPRKRRLRSYMKVRHRDIVAAQQELLEWCQNVEPPLDLDRIFGDSDDDSHQAHCSKRVRRDRKKKNWLEYCFWACGYHGEKRMTRCHIERYRPNEEEKPENFILLCELCHRDQPDAVPKDVLKYWLYTRECDMARAMREGAPIGWALKLLKEEFGESVLDAASKEFGDIDRMQRIADDTVRNSASDHPRTAAANAGWGVFAAIYAWCIANEEKIEPSNVEPRDPERVPAENQHEVAPKQLTLFRHLLCRCTKGTDRG